MAIEAKAITSNANGGIQINRELLKNPEKLRNICATKALTVSGEKKNAAELLAEIEKDILFYREGGGVTFSGGEPLSQGEDLIILLMQLKNQNIDVNIETTLHVTWENVERCIGLVGTFLVDLKHTDPVKFKTFTHGDAGLVLNNLKKLNDSEANIIIRIPVIPGFNHTESEMNKMIDFVSTLKNISEIHFLPYHTFGTEKYKMLGMEYLFGDKKPVQDSELEPYIQYAQSKNIYTKIGG
jgi:pyruvate formate lyase activating enzyme